MTQADRRTDNTTASAELAPRGPQQRRAEITTRTGPATLPELENRVAQLERLVWGRPHDALALDLCDPELRRLAAAAETGHALTTRLADPDIRTACERAIATWDEWHRQHRELLGAALAASHTIAITSAGQPGRNHAVAVFRAARSQLAVLATRRQCCLNAAIHARRQLDHDQLVRDRHQTEIEAGHEAWVTLLARLRVGLAAAVEHGQSLPGWLVLAIGPPSARSPATWRDFASDLFAYRITYGVTGGAPTLGAAPTSEHSPRRRHWHAELVRRLAAWQETVR
jgi:hypothetical protein